MKKLELLEKLENLKKPKIAVVGDFGIDEMVYGATSRISREAPVLILEHTKTDVILGTASNAAKNLATLSKNDVFALGIFGRDDYKKTLLDELENQKINTKLMVEDKSRKTTAKTRISGSCSSSITQQIVRIDRQSTEPISSDIEKKIIKNFEKIVQKIDAVILSDYHLGVLTPTLVSAIIKIAKNHGKIVVADAQKELEKYKGATSITPNQPDYEKFTNSSIECEKTFIAEGKKMLGKLELDSLLVTLGERGMALFEKCEKGTQFSQIPAYNKKEVFDVTGAGDTVVAVFTLALAAGLSKQEAMFLGNLAASIVIRHFGCHSVTVEDLALELKNL